MPIQIKKPKAKPCDLKYRKASAVGTAVTAVFIAALVWFILLLSKDNGSVLESSPMPAAVFAAAYVLYFASCVVSLVMGVKAYSREDNFTDLFQAICEFVVLVFCVMNLRLILVMTFSAFSLDSAAEKLLGSQTASEFVSGQYANWICLMVGTLITLIIGILGIVKLAANREK